MTSTSGDRVSQGGESQRSPADIEQDIHETRAELERTLDALQSRLSVRRRLDSAAASARGPSPTRPGPAA